jgi:hypothetical protein
MREQFSARRSFRWRGAELTAMTQKIFSPPNDCLRFLFLAALFSVRAFLLHLSKGLCHVFELIPNLTQSNRWMK